MTVYEILMIMIVGTLCITCGISFVYGSIVNTIERYQVRKKQRELEAFTKVIQEIPDVIFKTMDIIKGKIDEKDRKKKEREELLESLKDWKL